jgi:hypothetical protein
MKTLDIVQLVFFAAFIIAGSCATGVYTFRKMKGVPIIRFVGASLAGVATCFTLVTLWMGTRMLLFR